MRIDIANRLASIRRERGYSQENLAAELGVSRQAVSKWERAESSPDTDNLIALAELYGLTLDQLIRADEKGEKDAVPAGDAAEAPASPEQPEEPPAAGDAELAVAAPETQGETPPPDEETPRSHSRGEYVDVSWRGVHIVDTDGSEIYVGPGGIHVSEPRKGPHGEVVIEGDGVTINGVHYDTWQEARAAWGHRGRCGADEGCAGAAVVLLALAGLCAVGFFTSWGWGWAVCCLLLIPLWPGISGVREAPAGSKRHQAIRALWTMAVAAVFLVLGLGCGLWHPGWVVLLLIPAGQAIMVALWGCPGHSCRREKTAGE